MSHLDRVDGSVHRRLVRILMGTQVELGAGQGGARHVAGVVGAWARAGHQVSLVAPGAWAPGPAPDRVEHLTPRAKSPGLRMELALTAAALKQVALRAPEIAYVRLSASSSALPAALLSARLPLWLELNGPILDELRARGRGRARVEAVRASLRPLLGRARGLVAVEPDIAEHAREALGARRVFVVENGVDLEIARPAPRAEARRRLGLPDEGRWVGFAGSLSPEIRLDLVLPLLERHGLRLLVAGDGPGAASLKDHPRVRWLGPVDHARAIDVQRACDVCLGLREGWTGLRPLESVALGRRVALWGGRGSARLRRAAAELPSFVFVGEDPGRFEQALLNALAADSELGPPDPEALEAVRRRLGWDETARRLIELFSQG